MREVGGAGDCVSVIRGTCMREVGGVVDGVV